MRILLSLTLLWTANTFAVEPVELIEEVKLTNGLILEANNIDRIRFNRFDSKKVDWIESKDGVYLDRYDIERVELKLPNNPWYRKRTQNAMKKTILYTNYKYFFKSRF